MFMNAVIPGINLVNFHVIRGNINKGIIKYNRGVPTHFNQNFKREIDFIFEINLGKIFTNI